MTKKKSDKGRPKGLKKNPIEKLSNDVHILFRETDYNKLKEYARVRRQYLGELCREIILETIDNDIEFTKYELQVLKRLMISKQAQYQNLLIDQEELETAQAQAQAQANCTAQEEYYNERE